MKRLIAAGALAAGAIAAGIAPALAADGLPTVVIDRPAGLLDRTEWATFSTTIRIGYTGGVAYEELAAPVRVRTLFKRALLPNGTYATVLHQFIEHRDELAGLTDPLWSAWQDYPEDPELRVATLSDLPATDEQGRVIAYLYAVQVMDAAGAISLVRDFSRDVILFRVSEEKVPALWIAGEPWWQWTSTGVGEAIGLTVAEGQPLSFQWVGQTLPGYQSEIVAYRYGWDVADPNDPDDPGWALPVGNTPDHRRAPTRSFAAGVHSLTVRCWDLAGAMAQVVVALDVVPVPNRADQRPLLLVDDVKDKLSNGWPAGGVAYDNDAARDAFWREALATVDGFDPDHDQFDCEESEGLALGDLVGYRAVIWTGKGTGLDFIEHILRGVWLGAYQSHAGNLFVIGEDVLRPFAPPVGCEVPGFDPGFWPGPVSLPLSFSFAGICADAPCPGPFLVYALGFGDQTLPDGSGYLVGPTIYPARYMGVDVLDLTAHSGKYAGGCTPGRRSRCDGLKGLVLDPQFRAAHATGADLPDTILTWKTIDYPDDPAPPAYPDLARSYGWALDEFYDGNVVDPDYRPVSPQTLPGGQPVIEPMLRMHSRFDWLDGLHAARGDADWPANVYTTEQLREICGVIGLTADRRHAAVEGQATGFLSHACEATKPGGRPDFCWGFDPSRFDPEPMRQVIRWVVHDGFGLPWRPLPQR